jgi:hypothetical protein
MLYYLYSYTPFQSHTHLPLQRLYSFVLFLKHVQQKTRDISFFGLESCRFAFRISHCELRITTGDHRMWLLGTI